MRITPSRHLSSTAFSPLIRRVGIFSLFLLTLGNILLCVHIYRVHTLRGDIAWYEHALRMHDVSENPSYQGETFVIEHGVLISPDPRSLTISAHAHILARAYALATLRRNPLFGLPGSDPKTLFAESEELARVTKRLAEIQTTPEERVVVEEALYPLSFLRSLAELESRRERVLMSGSESDLVAYNHAFTATLAALQHDQNKFIAASPFIMNREHRRVVLPGGTLSTTSLLDTLTLLTHRTRTLETEFKMRTRCFAGDSTSCRPRIDIATDTPDPPPASTEGIEEIVAKARRINSLIDEAQYRTASTTFVSLLTSRCLDAWQRPPYTFAVWTQRTDGRATFEIKHRDTLLFFAPQSVDDPYFARLQKDVDTRFIYSNPLQHYRCPSNLADRARVFALTEIAYFATTHPTYATDARAILLRDPALITESQALVYLRSVLKQPEKLTVIDRHEVDRLIYLLTARNAGLEYLLIDIVDILETQQAQNASGIPIDLSAHALFSMHSAFPSLYLLETPLAGSPTPKLLVRNDSDQRLAADRFLTLESLSHNYTRTEIVHNLRAMLTIEGDLFSPSGQ